MYRFISLLISLIFLPVLTYSHPEVECLCHETVSNSFVTLSTFGFIVGVIVGIIAIAAVWLYFDWSLGLLQVPVLIFGLYLVVSGAESELFGLPMGFWGFVAAVCWASFASWLPMELGDGGTFTDFSAAFGLLGSVVWVPLAIWFDSSVIGFMAVFGIATFLLRMDMLDLAGAAFGVPDQVLSGRTSIVGIMILFIYFLTERIGLNVSAFKFGALYVSSVVISANLLVGTWSGWYRKSGFIGWLRYVWKEFVFLGSAYFMLAYGAILDSSLLSKIGGAFILAWMLVKVAQFIEWVFRVTKSLLLSAIIALCFAVLVIYVSNNLQENASWLQEYVMIFN
jgi:hypothetical protein